MRAGTLCIILFNSYKSSERQVLSERLGICPGLSRKWRSIDWEPGLSGFSGCALSSPAAIPAVLCTAKLQFPNCIETRVSFRLNTPLYMEPDASFQPYELPIPKRWLALLFPGQNIISICFSAILLTDMVLNFLLLDTSPLRQSFRAGSIPVEEERPRKGSISHVMSCLAYS